MASKRTNVHAGKKIGGKSRGMIGPPRSPAVSRNRRRTIFLTLAVILLLTGLVFSSSFANGFLTWDDPPNVTQNQQIREFNWENIKTYFTRPLLGMYSPLVYLSYALDYRMGELNPRIYHTTNLLLHLLNVSLVFFVMLLITKSGRTAAIVAALFAVHPMNVAGVAPISVRSSLLFSFFYLAAYLEYIRYIEKKTVSRLALSSALFLFSALSKSAAVVFLLLLLLTDYYYKRGFSVRVIVEKIPFFIISSVFALLTFVFREDTAATGSVQAFSFLERVFLSTFAMIFYLGKLIVPVNLSPFYPYPDRTGGHLALIYYAAPLLVLIIVALAAMLREQRKVLVFGGSFFLIHILLVLKVIPIGAEFLADRYVYLADIGLFFIVAEISRLMSERATRLVLGFLTAVVLVFSGVSYGRSAVWKDDMTFYNDIINTYPNAAVAYTGRGVAALKEKDDVAGAQADFDEAIRLDPDYADAYFNSATAKLIAKNYRGSLADANRAIALNPRRSEYYQIRANANVGLHDYQAAISDSSKTIEMNPQGADVYMAYLSLGVARVSLQDSARAIEDFSKAIELNPHVAVPYQNRANARVAIQDYQGAMADYRRAIELDPSFATAYYYRGLLREKLNDPTGTCEDFRRAAQLGLETARQRVEQVCKK